MTLKHKVKENSLDLYINDRVYHFSSLSEFGFHLHQRCNVSSDKLIELMDADIDVLTRELSVSKSVLFFIKQLLNNRNIDAELAKMNLRLFTNDYNWRDIFEALKHSNNSSHYVYLAFKKYRDYLTKKIRLLKKLCVKSGVITNTNTHEVERIIEKINGSRKSTSAVKEETQEYDTSITLAKLPKHVTLSINIRPTQEIEIKLASCHCKIVGGSPHKFIDNKGRSFVLKHGQNRIGRRSDNDIWFSDKCSDISRQHLVIVVYNDYMLAIKDSSSFGTYVPLNLIQHIENAL